MDSLLAHGDHDMHLADLASYVRIQEQAGAKNHQLVDAWSRRAVVFNVGHSGKFSSDRTIMEYARGIWRAKAWSVEQTSSHGGNRPLFVSRNLSRRDQTMLAQNQVYATVTKVLVEALGVEEDDIKPSATLQGDLGAESIDFLDIVFRLERAFGIRIPKGELFSLSTGLPGRHGDRA